VRYLFHDENEWKKFKNELLEWVGTPYRHMWNVKGRGADCAQFIGVALINAGIMDYYEFEYYSIDWFLHTEREILIEHIYKNRKYLRDGLDFLELPPNSDIFRGDYLVFSIKSPKGLGNHSAIAFGDGLMIHATPVRGVTITRVDSLKRGLKAIFRIIEA